MALGAWCYGLQGGDWVGEPHPWSTPSPRILLPGSILTAIPAVLVLPAPESRSLPPPRRGNDRFSLFPPNPMLWGPLEMLPLPLGGCIDPRSKGPASTPCSSLDPWALSPAFSALGQGPALSLLLALQGRGASG